MEETPKVLATPAEMAALYDVSLDTIYAWLNSGQVPGAFKVGRLWRVKLPVWRDAMNSVPAA